MSCGAAMKPEQIQQLKSFIGVVAEHPEILQVPELKFFRDYIESLGGTPPKVKKDEKSTKAPPKQEKTPEPEQTPVVESDESEVELDSEGVIDPETDPLPEVFQLEADKIISEEDLESSNSKRSEAMQMMSEQNFSGAVESYTAAIKLNPESAVLYAKRAAALLKQNRVKATIADCDQAVQRNPDSASALKLRGRAYRLLGDWLNAAKDLRQACKMDCDEQAIMWLAEVQPNASKLEEHQRKKQRRRDERELEKKRERVRQAKLAQEKARKEADEEAARDMGGMGGMPGMGGMGGMFGGMGGMPGGMGGMGGMPGGMGGMGGMPGGMPGGMGGMGGMPGGMGGMGGGMPGGMGGGMPGGMGGGMPGGMGGGMPDLSGLMNDPELMSYLADPEIAAAFGDVSKNPDNIFKYKDNPKMAKVINRMKEKMGGAGGGADDLPTDEPSKDAPAPPPGNDDLD